MLSYFKNKVTKTATGLKTFSLNVFDGGFVKRVFRKTDRAFGSFIFDQLDHEEKSESFSNAVERFNLTESDLLLRRKRFLSMSRLYLFFFAAGVMLGIWFFSVSALISTLGLSMIPLSLWFKWSFRAWQIRIRRLSGVKSFLKSEGWWYECFRSA